MVDLVGLLFQPLNFMLGAHRQGVQNRLVLFLGWLLFRCECTDQVSDGKFFWILSKHLFTGIKLVMAHPSLNVLEEYVDLVFLSRGQLFALIFKSLKLVKNEFGDFITDGN